MSGPFLVLYALNALLIGTFLSNNYKQAVGILHDVSSLRDAMVHLQIRDVSVFDRWLEEEKGYLKGLAHEPPEETVQLKYFHKLVVLTDLKYAHIHPISQPLTHLQDETQQSDDCMGQ